MGRAARAGRQVVQSKAVFFIAHGQWASVRCQSGGYARAGTRGLDASISVAI